MIDKKIAEKAVLELEKKLKLIILITENEL